MDQPLRIFIGFDSREPIAFHVLAHSILTRTSRPITIAPLTLDSVRHVYTRARGPLESTEFTYTRFLVPYLCGYAGHALFLDCDMLCRVDIGDLLVHVLADPGKAVYCCQHDYTPKAARKFLDQPQTAYPRKNWTSFFYVDCAQCRTLTPEYVNTATGLMLHRLWWMDDARVGALPLEWNWLAGEYPPNVDAKILHYTNGGPWFADCADCDHADLWRAERDAMQAATRLEVPA